MMIQRLYSEHDVSSFTLNQVENLIEQEGIGYSGDYGFKVKENVMLIHSEN
jgi:hypothetical protein